MEGTETKAEDFSSSSSSSSLPFSGEDKPAPPLLSDRSDRHASFSNAGDHQPAEILESDSSSEGTSSSRAALHRQEGEKKVSLSASFATSSSSPCTEEDSMNKAKFRTSSSSLQSLPSLKSPSSPGRASLGLPQTKKEEDRREEQKTEATGQENDTAMKGIQRGRGPPRASAAARKLMENDETLKKILTDTEQLENLRQRNVRKEHEKMAKGFQQCART